MSRIGSTLLLAESTLDICKQQTNYFGLLFAFLKTAQKTARNDGVLDTLKLYSPDFSGLGFRASGLGLLFVVMQ